MQICIAINSGSLSYSETFIKAHVDGLQAKLINIYDYYPFPFLHNLSRDSFSKSGAILLKRILNKTAQHKAKAFFKKNNIGLILAEYGVTGALAVELCQATDIPLVVHFHGFDAYEKEILNIYGSSYQEMFSYAKAIIAVSRDMERQLISLGAPTEKVHYNTYGINTKAFAQVAPQEAPPTLLAVGRFTEKKGPYLTILAFQKVLSEIPEAKLMMVGNGELLNICKLMVHALKIENAVQFLDAAAHDQIPVLMKNVRAFVQHSHIAASGDSEGTPLAILEAGAAGLPVISTEHAGIKDVVIHGKTGLLVKEGDIDTMSEYMYQLLYNPQQAKELGENARNHISTHYSMEKSISNLRKIILDEY